MKTRSVLFVVLAGFFLALIAATLSLQSVQAQTCYNQQQQPVPCPKPDYKNPTKPAPSPNSTQTATTQPAGANCIQNPLASSASIPNTGAGGSSGSPLSPYLFGGGGLLVGVLGMIFLQNLIGAPIGIMRGVPPPRSAGKVPTNGADEVGPGGGC